jgi:hypothetical protein
MANEELQSILTLRDQMSAPLKHIHASLGVATKDMQKLQKETKQSTSFTKQFTQSMIPEIAAGELLADTIKAIPGALVDLVSWTIKATASIVELVSAETSWMEKTRGMFAVLGKANDDGKLQLKIVQDLASELYVQPQKIAAVAQDLLESGVRNQRELQNDLRAVTEMQRFGGDAAANRLKEILKRSASSRGGFMGRDTFAGGGFASAGELQSIGVEQKDFYARLSKIRGQTVTQFALQTGMIRVSSKQFQQALTESVSAGKVGKGARDMVGGLEEVRAHWSAVWSKIVKDVDFGPLMKALHGLIAVFDPLSQSGKANAMTLTGALNLMVKGLTWAVKTGTLWMMKLEIAFLKAFIVIAPVVLKIAKWVKKHMDVIKAALISVAVVMGIVAVALAVTTFIAFLPLLILVGALVVAFGILIAVMTAVALAVMYVKKHLSEWGQAAKNAAADLIDGLVSGIRKGIGGVKSAINDLSTGALKTMKDALGIHSPSTEFAKLGHFAGMGFAGGFDASMGGMNLALPAGKIAGGGGGPGEIHLGGIEVNITGVKDAEKIAPSLIPALTDAIEQILIEWGH